MVRRWTDQTAQGPSIQCIDGPWTANPWIHSLIIICCSEFNSVLFFLNVEMYCVITLSQQLSGAAMVRRWSAYIHLHPPAASMVSSVRFL